MRNILIRVMAGAGILLASTLPLIAHHSFAAEFDATKAIRVTGTLAKVEWTNPHTHFYLDVTDEKGKVTNWKWEGYNLAVLYRIGWKKDLTIKPGDKITVSGWRARDGGNWAHSREVTLPGGKKLFFGPPSGTGDGGTTPAVEVQ